MLSRRNMSEGGPRQSELGSDWFEVSLKAFDQPLPDLPEFGGPYTMKEGSIIQSPDGTKNVLARKDMDVEIGPPSSDVLSARQLKNDLLSVEQAKTLSPLDFIRDRRDVIDVKTRKMIGSVFGDEIYTPIDYKTLPLSDYKDLAA